MSVESFVHETQQTCRFGADKYKNSQPATATATPKLDKVGSLRRLARAHLLICDADSLVLATP
jgi:hypothetical protein